MPVSGEARNLLLPQYDSLLRVLDDRGATLQEYNASVHTHYARRLRETYGEGLRALQRYEHLLAVSEKNLRLLAQACDVFSGEVAPAAAEICKETIDLLRTSEDRERASLLVAAMEFTVSNFVDEKEFGEAPTTEKLAGRISRLATLFRSISNGERMQRAASQFSSKQFQDQTLLLEELYVKVEALQMLVDLLKNAEAESRLLAENSEGGDKTVGTPESGQQATVRQAGELASGLLSLCSALKTHFSLLAQTTLEAYCSRLAVLLKLGIQNGLFHPQPDSLEKQLRFHKPCRIAYFFSVSRYRFLLSDIQGHAQAAFFTEVRGAAESCVAVAQRLYDVTVAYVKYYTAVFGSAEDVCSVLSGISTGVIQLCSSLIQEGKLGAGHDEADERHTKLVQFGPSRHSAALPSTIRDFIGCAERLSILQEFCERIKVPLSRNRDGELLDGVSQFFSGFMKAAEERDIPLLSKMATSSRTIPSGESPISPSSVPDQALQSHALPRPLEDLGDCDQDVETERMISYTLLTILSSVSGALRVEFSRRMAAASFFEISSPPVLQECERILSSGKSPDDQNAAAEEPTRAGKDSDPQNSAEVRPSALAKAPLTHVLAREILDTLVRICAASGSQQSYPATIGTLLCVNQMVPSAYTTDLIVMQLSELLAKLIVRWYSVHRGNEYSGALAAASILQDQDLPTYFHKMQDAVFREARRLVGKDISDDLLRRSWTQVAGGQYARDQGASG